MVKCDIYQCDEEAFVRIENVYDGHYYLRCKHHFERDILRFRRLEFEGRIKIIYLVCDGDELRD